MCARNRARVSGWVGVGGGREGDGLPIKIPSFFSLVSIFYDKNQSVGQQQQEEEEESLSLKLEAAVVIGAFASGKFKD